MASSQPLIPHVTPNTKSIRKIYIQSLTDCLHACLLRGEVGRARRAWAILIRCREVDWKSRWYWGLAILGTDQNGEVTDQDGKDREKWLRTLRVSARDEDKPSLLHALILHLIKHERYRAASDELDTYLPSYPYFLSATLHTYAGLLSFYLAQPADRSNGGLPNPSMLNTARVWFNKALDIDNNEQVAREFIRLIDEPDNMDGLSDKSDEKSDEMEKEDSFASESEDEDEDRDEEQMLEDHYEDADI